MSTTGKEYQEDMRNTIENSNANFRLHFDRVSRACHKTALDHGFHNTDIGDLGRIALIHSELSEALEALRHGNPPDDKLPSFQGAVVELADAVIRIADMCERNNWPLSDAILAKMQYNHDRPYMHGGKAF